MRVITETDKLKIEFSYETAQLVNKENNEIIFQDDFYGDPTCGLIDKQNKWVVICGTHLTLWKENEVKRFESKEFRNIHQIRLKTQNQIQILTDPWDKKSAIWELDLNNNELIKIEAFKSYFGQPYCEIVTW